MPGRGFAGPWLFLVSGGAGRLGAETLSVQEDLCLPPVFTLCFSFGFFHLYFFFLGGKVARREGGKEGQGILICSGTREAPRFGRVLHPIAQPYLPMYPKVQGGANLLPSMGDTGELHHRPGKPLLPQQVYGGSPTWRYLLGFEATGAFQPPKLSQ